ncbi:flagellar type III secretion system pore protein FliP [Vagococcus fluvialis]|jgi:flagellar biosynthetic protein FliP|uniref:Flagellar biosynthetic protein FliP n=1 Tax=Vagococcus fluvialis TaxID=2738 RepID=A0A369AVM9_9ENTE|nr:flagellar type III secretion system pore protein FliP [Vagococcus fluvialis]MDR2278755.1 flagellar type III secretion system pore protein FliP [Vagococcus sp.]OTP29637.1 flagellar biosynthetic protein FliP [Enterococcus sp. 6C8_DIV0013]MBO0419205.1 flagellar type III secretion system pore protein FliP [Vagococcus fluvialis]MBO0429041.1 flagellar type III secretion system pore protein FliP [Vagococcus fluvialis]MBO0485847.1 flagellar type III secretion system pore protein FliP [Vagococcus fl
MKKQIKSIFCLILLGLFVLPTKVIAVDVNELSDTINKISGNTGSSDSVKMFVMMTVLTLIPALLILTTSFTRIIMVLSFVRSSLGTQQTPPNQVLIGIALFLTFFIMHPVYNEVNKVAIQPLIKDEISQSKAIEEAEKPIKKFMLKETREKDLALFVKYSNLEKVKNPESLPTYVVVPAFLISELRTAFSIGFLIFIPFLIIDMAVSSILMSMGMFMLSPVMISLPFKLLLFVLVDGWYLVVETLVRGFQ